MSERKPGWLERLFGGAQAPTEPREQEPRPPQPPPPAPEPPPPPVPEPPRPGPEPGPLPGEIPPIPEELPPAPGEVPEPVRESPEPPGDLPPTPAAGPYDTSLAGPPEASADYVEDLKARRGIGGPQDEGASAQRPSWLKRLGSGLRRSSDQLTGGLTALFTKKKLDQAMLDELEDLLIQADFGLDTALSITEALKRDRFDRAITADEVRAVLASEVARVLEPVAQPLAIETGHRPFVILMVGVNGSGKTTTIGKLAAKLRAEGKSVLLAAGDTFRAAAIEQLEVWGQRTGAEVVSRPAGSDASGLAFDALTRARGEGADVLIIDTAGRLQNRDELMGELEKIIRVIRKIDETAPHATLLTLDATTGQNALNQVEIFGRRAGVTGLVMTKLDGTARGGILVAIARRFGLPVHFIGVGESVEDLQPFTATEFADAIVGRNEAP